MSNEPAPALGAQGGDVSDDIELDLSSCVNPYGPPPQVIDALRTMDPEVVKRHPYEAPAFVETMYGERLGVAEAELVAARGASELIWQLAAIAREKGWRVALPTPAYTEYVKCFPSASMVPGRRSWHDADQLESAASQAQLLVFSNPHNPTGRLLARSEVTAVAKRHEDCVFVVDESYADFLADDTAVSSSGCDLPNVVVIRSPTKFFGLGGVRIGVAWTKSDEILSDLRKARSTWPVSMLDARLVRVAFEARDWQETARSRLANDAAWLDGWLGRWSDLYVVDGPLHFRLVQGAVDELQAALLASRASARALSPAHGFDVAALRIASPPEHERHRLEAIVNH